MKLNYKRTILVGFAFFLISAFWQAYDAIVPMILNNHFGLNDTASGVIMSIDNVLAVFMLPLFGAFSDKVNTKYGKRTPFIFFGAITAVVVFICLTLVDGAQLSALTESGLTAKFDAAKATFVATENRLSELVAQGNADAIAELDAASKAFTAAKSALRAEALELTLSNIFPLVGFVAVLLVVLIAMATFRSPAVALMPDVTVKPLRSKGNAIINLMGTAGGILVLGLGMVFSTSSDPYMHFGWYVVAVCCVMLVGLGIFLATVKEKKWAEEMEEDTRRLGLDEPTAVTKDSDPSAPARALSKAEMKSLLLILASVALWYIGYNSITSKYSYYASTVLGFDYNFTLIIAQAAAVVAYIPVGIIASKIGRRKTILAGITLLATAFFIGNFINPTTPPAMMYPVFVLAGIGWATINVNSFPMVVELAKGGEVGKYTGYYYTASMAAQIVAPILSGIFYDLIGIDKVFFAFGTIFVVFSFITMFFVKHGDARAESKGALESLAGADD